MFPAAVMSNSTSLSEEPTVSSSTKVQNFTALNHVVSVSTIPPQQPQKIKRKRNLPGNPDPDAEVIALSPKTLMTTNRFVCEICNKGFQRDQNLQLHRRGHNLPWKLKQRNSKEVKKRVYVCPEPSCVHHNPSRALGDLTGIKKHYCRKHGEKKWKCDKCSKIYAVQSDWRAHSKTCGTREYRCDCGTLFSRKDSFLTHRAFCDALAQESARVRVNQPVTTNPLFQSLFPFQNQVFTNPWDPSQENPNPSNFHNHDDNALQMKPQIQSFQIPSLCAPSLLQESMINSPLGIETLLRVPSNAATSPHLSATALLQKAATVGATAISGPGAAVGPQSTMGHGTQYSVAEFGTVTQIDSVGHAFARELLTRNIKSERLTRDFLGLTAADAHGGHTGNSGGVDVIVDTKDMLSFAGGVEYQQYHHYDHHSPFKSEQSFGFFGTTTAPETWGNS